MKSKVSTAILLLCSFVSLGQTTSRMATNQAKPRLESPPNIVAVDRSDTLVNRMWVYTIDSLKIRPFQMRWWRDSTGRMINQRMATYTPAWESISGKPAMASVATTGNFVRLRVVTAGGDTTAYSNEQEVY